MTVEDAPTSAVPSNDPEPSTPSTAISRSAWFAVAAAVTMMACLCGVAAGSIIVSAGVSAYAGLSGVAITQVVTQIVGVNPNSSPFPTYTFPPTLTPLPTYTEPPYLPPAIEAIPTIPYPPALPATPTPEVLLVSPTLPASAGAQTTSQPPALTEDIEHTIVDGDTLESILQQYGVDRVPVVYANDLDPDDPQLEVGEILIIPWNISEWCVPGGEPVTAEVLSVVDGDTIEVSIGGQTFTVRYIGVDAPAAGSGAEPFGEDAAQANRDLVEGKTVTLIEDITNANDDGELPRYVLIDSTFANYEMARQGFAVSEIIPPDQSCSGLFELAVSAASNEGIGMWSSTTASSATPTLQTASPGSAATLPAVVWQAPPSITPTATSSLGFSCHCWGKSTVWGNFVNAAQAEACNAICDIQEQRQAALCATAAVNGSGVGCR